MGGRCRHQQPPAGQEQQQPRHSAPASRSHVIVHSHQYDHRPELPQQPHSNNPPSSQNHPNPKKPKPTQTQTQTKTQKMQSRKPTLPLPPHLSRNFTDASLVTSPLHLLHQTHWIRNTLDPQIALSGPEALSSTDLLDLDSFLRSLLSYAAGISLETLRATRIHLAVLDICGRATRWPVKVIERAEAIGEVWENRYGVLGGVGWEVGVEGWEAVVGAERQSSTALLRDLNVGRARRFGSLGFKPGDWWINTLFAFHAGILDSPDPSGGIISDSKGAYAILLTGSDELSSLSPETFFYRARESDKGRYRLTAATIDSRHPVRVLRSHALRSFWSPRAGVRYEGLYKATSWSIAPSHPTSLLTYDITLKRLPTETPSMESVLLRPWTEEVEDYGNYKRFKRQERVRREEAAELKTALERKPSLVVSGSDGAEDLLEGYPGRRDSRVWDVYGGESGGESPKGSVVVRRTDRGGRGRGRGVG